MDDLEVLQFVNKLPSAEGYTQNDRYRDFRELFNTDQGKRVLREILGWCHLFRPSVQGSPVDIHLLAVRDGEANIGKRLLLTMNQEPSKRPQTTTREPDNA